MDLRGYLSILKANLWVIALTLFVTIAVTVAGTYMITPIYTATSTLRIASANSGTVSYSDFVYADRLMNTYVRIAASGPVLAEVAQRMGVAASPPVKIAVVPNTELIQISADSADPRMAQLAANTLAAVLEEQGRELYSGGVKSQVEILAEQIAQAEAELNAARAEFETNPAPNAADLEAQGRAIDLKEKTYSTLLDQYEQARLREAMRSNTIALVEPARLPSTPSRPRPLVNLALGGVVGLAGGLGLAFLFENLNGRVRSTDQVEEITGLPILTRAPFVSVETLSPVGSEFVIPEISFREAIRRLRANIIIRSQNGNGPRSSQPRTLLVVSAEQGEGKSTIVSHLALALAQAGKSVVLVDADLRLGKLHQLMDLPNTIGLSNLLRNSVLLDEALQCSRSAGLDVITSGPPPQSPSELLGSQRVVRILDELHLRYDFVLVDAPALLPVADAAILAPLMDAVVLVTRRAFIREDALREVLKQLKGVHANLMGVVVNQAEPSSNYSYYRRK